MCYNRDLNLFGKKVLVCGLARSGISATRLLLSKGALVSVADSMPFEKLSGSIRESVKKLQSDGVDLFLGSNPDDILRRFDLIIISPGIPEDTPFIKKAKFYRVPVWGELELGFHFCSSPIIAITGTNGKTTTTTLVSEIMKKFRPGSEALGNIGTPLCEKAESIPENAYAVVEVSSFQLESTYRFHPVVSAVLNIAEDHLNRHKTMQRYITLKERVFQNQNPSDILVLNYDDPVCLAMSKKSRAQKAFFSIKGEPKLFGRLQNSLCVFLDDNILYCKKGTYYEKILNITELKTPFKHIIEDALAAAAISLAVNAPIEIISDTIKNFSGVPHRIEHVALIGGTDYFNDSKATNVNSAIKALESINKPVIIIGGGQDKGADFTRWISLFEKKVSYAVLIGETADKIIEACKTANFKNWEKAKNLSEAVSLAASLAQPGECVLLSPACASLDMFKDYEERGNLFKEYVHNLKALN